MKLVRSTIALAGLSGNTENESDEKTKNFVKCTNNSFRLRADEQMMKHDCSAGAE